MKVNDITIDWTYYRRYRKPLAGEPLKLSQESVYDGTDTICVLENNGEILSHGQASCSPKDNFCRATGRKLSLARALQGFYFTKEQRQEIWEAYRRMTVKPRW